MDTEGTAQDRFEALLDQHRGILFRVVRTYCRRTEDQQDLAQEIRLQLWRSLGKFDGKRAFSTWMYRIAINVAVSWTRLSSNRKVVSLADVDEPATTARIDDDQRELYALIDGLDSMNKALLLLTLEDLNHAEIGEVLGISAINVATKLSRLRQRLRAQASGNQTWN